jgi:hypothetical protein
MLRDHSRQTHRKLVDLAEAVVVGHPLLPAGTDLPPQPSADPRI